MKNALVMMTALVPTTGHAALIRFAAGLPNTMVHVFINGRTFEPYKSLQRWEDLHGHFADDKNVHVVHGVDDSAPQNPEDLPGEFWNWWKESIGRKFPNVKNWDYVVASEPYGQNVADILEAQFIPYDLERTLNSSRGTEIRNDLWNNWKMILPETRRKFHLRATLFGQESVGKTTVSKLICQKLGIQWIPEYARPYLETVGSEITSQKMENIFAGQTALQKMMFRRATDPVTVMDTDLMSTVGYFPIMNCKIPENVLSTALSLKSDVYYVMPDDIEFIPDQLRYGDNKRESDQQYWIDLLNKNRLDHVLVPSGTAEEKADWIIADLKNRFHKSTEDIRTFRRE